MTKIYEAAFERVALPTAAWDLTSFLENAKSQIQLWGGLLLMLLGAVGLVWGGVLLIKKLMATPQSAGQQQGWGTIALLILVGGALGTGGWSLINTIGSGGQKTLEDLGGGSVLVQTVSHVLTSGVLG
ncbi:hypothetical protein ACIQF8_03260 [Pseudarthrobacter sp. NPDC092184]|jgi:hypothetical protein|uniref:hypothetical protein n=1 Tax=Micrococcaceae TaxID=1268 RepID=UPI0008A6E259|nr:MULTISPECIES: hypothetical protein [Micrococcaceae]AOY70986.1 hypothetical protein ARZXY2_1433 [Arthrobacter sp. ZXY-2]MCQ6272056.1 hypothetical protein [Pseudarthrobacter sp. R1]MCR1163279.1 hypothetical protein [Paenarthrobacter sp. UW852]MEE2522893.1 hypothetical protein [Pseudarthrobacter sp. J47]TQS91848.1 hypothetical protein EU811_13740 [Arthrobacter sp. TS-15]